jgi:hypothetical protein
MAVTRPKAPAAAITIVSWRLATSASWYVSAAPLTCEASSAPSSALARSNGGARFARNSEIAALVHQLRDAVAHLAVLGPGTLELLGVPQVVLAGQRREHRFERLQGGLLDGRTPVDVLLRLARVRGLHREHEAHAAAVQLVQRGAERAHRHGVVLVDVGQLPGRDTHALPARQRQQQDRHDTQHREQHEPGADAPAAEAAEGEGGVSGHRGVPLGCALYRSCRQVERCTQATTGDYKMGRNPQIRDVEATRHAGVAAARRGPRRHVRTAGVADSPDDS